jgi:Domain of unknown function (DUF6458)
MRWPSTAVSRPERRGCRSRVPLGTSIFLIAAGAILRSAVTASTPGINLHTVGLILIVVGIAGLVVSLLWMTAWSPRRRAGDRAAGRDPPAG